VSGQDLGWALLFLVVVGLMVAVGVAVGMIVAGRMDRLVTPRPPKPADEPAAVEPASAEQPPVPNEEEQP
jgi:hypothetical protein